ncbi:MAG: peptidylprolyl isomerase, partial [Patescibacteria group bacterium]
MHRSALVVIPIAIVILGGIWYFSSSKQAQAPSTSQTDQYATSTPQTQNSDQGTPEPGANSGTPITNTTNTAKIMQATLHTNQGDIVIEFSSATPNTVANFVKLAEAGFYSGTKFHRVIKGF